MPGLKEKEWKDFSCCRSFLLGKTLGSSCGSLWMGSESRPLKSSVPSAAFPSKCFLWILRVVCAPLLSVAPLSPLWICSLLPLVHYLVLSLSAVSDFTTPVCFLRTFLAGCFWFPHYCPIWVCRMYSGNFRKSVETCDFLAFVYLFLCEALQQSMRVFVDPVSVFFLSIF